MPSGIYERKPKHNKKISESMKGRKLSKIHKQRISDAHKGKILSNATKKKMSEYHKGRK